MKLVVGVQTLWKKHHCESQRWFQQRKQREQTYKVGQLSCIWGDKQETSFTPKYKIHIKWKASLVPVCGRLPLLEICYPVNNRKLLTFLNWRVTWVKKCIREVSLGPACGSGLHIAGFGMNVLEKGSEVTGIVFIFQSNALPLGLKNQSCPYCS